MALTLSRLAREAACGATVRLLDSRGAPGRLRFFDGDSNVLAEFALPFPAFGPPEDGRARARGLPLTAIATQAAGTGREIAWYDAVDASGERAWMGTVSTPDGGGDLVLDNVVLVRGQAVTLTEWTHTQG